MKITGKITKILETQKGTSKAGKDWEKLIFTLETDEEYNNLYALDIFGVEKVNNFIKYNKVGDVVSVNFNINTNEWKGKYFTSLQAWKVVKAGEEQTTEDTPAEDLPF